MRKKLSKEIVCEMKIHEQTIHFDDRPWSVRGYVYGNDIRFRFTVPEDLIFSQTGKATLNPSDMIEWVKQNRTGIENYCDKYAKRRQNENRPLSDNDDIIILNI